MKYINLLSIVVLLVGIYLFQSKYSYINLRPPSSFMSAIEEFEKTRNDIATEINLIVRELIVKSNNNESSLHRISIAWKKGWNNIYNKINKLENDYSKIEIESEFYFLILSKPLLIEKKDWVWFGKTKLFSISKNLKTNYKIKESLTSILEKTKININQLKNLVRESLGLYKILSFSTTQDEFERNIEDLKTISNRIQILSNSLRYLVNTGQKLAEQRPVIVELIPVRFATN